MYNVIRWNQAGDKVLIKFINKDYMDKNALNNVIDYCTNPAKCLYELIGGYNVIPCIAEQQMRYTKYTFRKESGNQLIHLIVSFDGHGAYLTAIATGVAKSVTKFIFGNYQSIYAIHKNTDNTHIHFVINSVSCIDGTRLVINRNLKESLNILLVSVLENDIKFMNEHNLHN